ncbi:TldD/PmbA family protein [Desnuesiella massiliensis]|uniref:TldD/PmbA family protein n=1 Tax=Desnuesiella massiliensis TaxID=1650662 RepID=UPI0006E1D1AB|nr:metallopeptidase TldD-related protein [Desnuesiella massiliensis]
MDNRDLALYCVNAIKALGVDKASCSVYNNKKYELNFTREGISLLRTTIDGSVSMLAIKNGKKATIALNKLDKNTINSKIDELIEMTNSAETDPCNDIAEYQEKEDFFSGNNEPDLDKMYDLTRNFLAKIEKDYPQINFMDGTTLSFDKVESVFVNSNGVEFKISKGIYNASVVFLAKEGDKSTSFNYFAYSFEELPEDLMEYADVRQRMEDIIKQLHCSSVGKFIGDIILTPESAMDMIGSYIMNFLSDSPLISGTSILKDKLNEKVAKESLTVKCMPLAESMADKNFITTDGIKTENLTLVEAGVLKSFVLGLYAAKKTGKAVAKTALNLVVEGGNTSLQDIIKNTKKGIILGRFSGGNPANNGDFAGVAKNSFYVEDGEIKYALSETMISSNLYDMFNNIEDISIETINSGSTILPWIKVNGVNISGK